MGWKPCRGSGTLFDKAQIREQKYKDELNYLINNPKRLYRRF